MSKFIDKLSQAAQDTPEPMGFRKQTQVAPRAGLLLVASLTQTNLEGAARFADALLVRISDYAEAALQKISKSAAERPWGAWVESDSRTVIKRVAKAGCDFVVFPAVDTPVDVFEKDEPGRIIQVDLTLGEGFLRAINGLPVDAVLAVRKEEAGEFVSWHNIIVFQRFGDLLAKPLLVSVPASVTDRELQALWDVGVSGVVVELGEAPTERLQELRQALDQLTPSPRKRGKLEALLPMMGGSEEAEVEEEEEEDE